MPLQYVTNQIRTIVKAVGELDTSSTSTDAEIDGVDDNISNGEEEIEEQKSKQDKIRDEVKVDARTYRPRVEKNQATECDEWLISETDLEFLSWGAYVLGCAGGGQPESTRIMLRDRHLREGHSMRVIDSSSLSENAVIYW